MPTLKLFILIYFLLNSINLFGQEKYKNFNPCLSTWVHSYKQYQPIEHQYANNYYYIFQNNNNYLPDTLFGEYYSFEYRWKLKSLNPNKEDIISYFKEIAYAKGAKPIILDMMENLFIFKLNCNDNEYWIIISTYDFSKTYLIEIINNK